MIIFNRTDSANADFQRLVAMLDADLAARDGSDHSFYAQFNKINNLRNVIVCYSGNEAVGCGAFKPFESNIAEIKRMFVLQGTRGNGIGMAILKELEKWAAELNFSQCVLETGKRQPEAIRLYERAGYERIKNYGQYENVENSVCMRKSLLSTI